jgi:hypothetical protein
MVFELLDQCLESSSALRPLVQDLGTAQEQFLICAVGTSPEASQAAPIVAGVNMGPAIEHGIDEAFQRVASLTEMVDRTLEHE